MELGWVFDNLTINALIDILLVGLLFFGLSFFIRGTQGVALLRGVVFVLVGMIVVSSVFQLTALSWLLNNSLLVLLVAIPVIFQPELRRGLESLGRAGTLLNNRSPNDNHRTQIIEDICTAAERLSERRHGALIVLERNSSLQEYIRTGVPLNSDISPELFLTIFWPKTELHDGATIIDSSGRLASAASVLPLSATRNLPNRKLGTRHRAALGMSEISDAICIIVSEETGRISIADSGRMIPRLDVKRLRTILHALYGTDRGLLNSPWTRLREQANGWIGQLQDWRKQV